MVWERLGSASVTGSVPNNSWKLLDRATLTSAGDSIDTGTFTAKDNIMILEHKIPTGNARSKYRFNNDSGSNYTGRRSQNGGSDWTFTSESFLYQYHSGGSETEFAVAEYINNSAQEKLGVSRLCNDGTAGAGNAPKRDEYAQKWANTSAQINRVEVFNDGTGSYNTGSEIVVLGYDNDEADSGTNFWEELVSVSGTGSSTSLSSGTFAAKKYLKFRLWANNTAAMGFQCNGDTGSNYARRYNYTGGGSDGTTTSGTSINVPNNHTNMLTEGYIVNNASTEKLVIFSTVDTSTAGAGTAPDRSENVGKWTNTSDQITSMVWSKGGNFDSNAQLTIWGAD